MVVLGVGLGLVMPVLVLAVQNAVPRPDMGMATAASIFFRSIGGVFGVAIFGAIFANRLAYWLPRELPASAHMTLRRPRLLLHATAGEAREAAAADPRRPDRRVLELAAHGLPLGRAVRGRGLLSSRCSSARCRCGTSGLGELRPRPQPVVAEGEARLADRP